MSWDGSKICAHGLHGGTLGFDPWGTAWEQTLSPESGLALEHGHVWHPPKKSLQLSDQGDSNNQADLGSRGSPSRRTHVTPYGLPFGPHLSQVSAATHPLQEALWG